MYFLKNNKGITLIALAITIIVMIILAGVTIKTMNGTAGILRRSNIIVDESVVKSSKEQAESLSREYIEKYYSERYSKGNKEYSNAKEYLADILKNGESRGSFWIKTDGSQKIYTYRGEHDTNPIAKGSIESDGFIDWDD